MGVWVQLQLGQNNIYINNGHVLTRRQPTSFRDKITADGSSGYKAEAGRYDAPPAMVCLRGRVCAKRVLDGSFAFVCLSGTGV